MQTCRQNPTFQRFMSPNECFSHTKYVCNLKNWFQSQEHHTVWHIKHHQVFGHTNAGVSRHKTYGSNQWNKGWDNIMDSYIPTECHNFGKWQGKTHNELWMTVYQTQSSYLTHITNQVRLLLFTLWILHRDNLRDIKS